MDLDKIVDGLKYHTSIEQKETNLEKLLKQTGWFSPRQQDMRLRYIDGINYHTQVETKSLIDRIKEIQ